MSGETFLKEKTPLVVGGTLTQVLAESNAIAASALNHCATNQDAFNKQNFLYVAAAEGQLVHALSWRRLSNDVTKTAPNARRIRTKLWIPNYPTSDDISFLTNPDSTVHYSEMPEPYVY